MNITLIGGAGFIGINLARRLSSNHTITVIDSKEVFFETVKSLNLPINYGIYDFSREADFDEQVKNQDIVFHLASTIIPGESNYNIASELEANVNVTCELLDACVRQGVKKVVFISSGGAVYGKKGKCPVKEDMVTYPISSYGIQKVTIEKLLYLYRYKEGLDYRVIRLANPYGPYQRPNGRLGVVTTFLFKALHDTPLDVYGDGNVVRDFIYIDDAIRGIENITFGESDYRVFNLGSGVGTSIKEVIETIAVITEKNLRVNYIAGRRTDVPENYLNIERYEKAYGKLNPMSLKEGIMKTMEYMTGKEDR